MNSTDARRPGYYAADDCDLEAFKALTSQTLDGSTLRFAASVEKNVPVYDIDVLRPRFSDQEFRYQIMAEWADILQHSAGVLVLKNAYDDTSAIDAATKVYEDIIAREKEAPGGGADHFAAAGKNDRVWNSLQKLCEHAPETFVQYFANPAIDTMCEAWLGPNYQMTAQVNLVHPGGGAQLAHRDYHLGFQSAEISATYPAHVHDLSPLMTLQGGIAHCDMPVESGPTRLLPFSQQFRSGYAAWRREDFRAHFEQHHIQLPLKKGDAIFFSPALFHAAGANASEDIHRFVNLLQISSPFGRAMETVNRKKMCQILYPHIRKAFESGALSESRLQAVIAASAEGYSFPTNLDLDPPIGGLAPETQQALLLKAVHARWSEHAFSQELTAQEERKKA
jgi:ectoine hydroxylase-related dioxygenase (phytanoyl-CoA dioxygenase family)